MTLREERELASSAAGILETQRLRMLTCAEALIQWIEMVRPCDWRPEDREAYEAAKRYVLMCRKKEASREENRPAEERRAG